MKSICLIEAGDGQGTGILIKDNLVVTSMHVLVGRRPQEVKVLFGYYKTKPSNWISINTIDPPPPSLAPSASRDFAVMQLAQSRSSSDVAPADFSWQGCSQEAFVLAHPGGMPMTLSFYSEASDPDLCASDGVMELGKALYGSGGSSGAGVFNDNGSLVGIVKGGREFENKLTVGVPIKNIVDEHYGSELAKNAFGVHSTVTIPPGWRNIYLWATDLFAEQQGGHTGPGLRIGEAAIPHEDVHVAYDTRWFANRNSATYEVPFLDIEGSGKAAGIYSMIMKLRGSVSTLSGDRGGALSNGCGDDGFGWRPITLCELGGPSYSVDPVARVELVSSSSGNKVKSGPTSIRGRDLTTNECSSYDCQVYTRCGHGPCSVALTYKLEIRDPHDVRLRVTTSSGMQDVFGKYWIVGFSIHGIELVRESPLSTEVTTIPEENRAEIRF